MERNYINYVAIGRVKDATILVSALTNKSYADKQTDYSAYCVTLLNKQNQAINEH